MPLYKTISVNQNTVLYIWKIEESFEELQANIMLSTKSEQRLLSMKSELHQKGFLSIRQLLKVAGYRDFDLFYTPNGKPHLKSGEKISITHSFNFSALIVSNVEVGIDIEKNRDKIKIIQNKFVNFERGFLNKQDDLVQQLTVIWGAKESLYKIYPYGGLTFKNDIDILPFNLKDKKTTGYIKVDNWDKNYNVFFEQIENFTLVYALEINKNG